MVAPDELRALDDAVLAARIAAASPSVDGQSEAELYRRLAPRIRLYGLRHLRNAHAAGDLMQQVMLVTIESMRAGKLRDPERLASFVFGTCRRLMLDGRRTEARRDRLLGLYGDDLHGAEPQESSVFERDRLLHCLERLNERERSVLVATFFEDKPADVVAHEIGVTAGNVRVIRHRGLERLRVCMGIDGAAT